MPSPLDRLLLPTPAEMAEIDRRTIADGTDGFTLMQRAAAAVVQAIRARWERRPVLVLCGPGNNGGDGYCIAADLAARGWQVVVEAPFGPPPTATSDAGRASALWQGRIADFGTTPAGTGWLVVDAVFGAGLNRPVAQEALDRLHQARQAGAAIVAVDVPSGLDGASGLALGGVRLCPADLTVTFHAAKPGHLLMPGRVALGDLVVADIGLSWAATRAVIGDGTGPAFRNQPPLWRSLLPRDRIDDHKYTRGVLAILGGQMGGAAILAAAAARRIGLGHLTLITDDDHQVAAALSRQPGVIVLHGNRLADWRARLDDRRLTAALIGPGATPDQDTRAAVLAAAAAPVALVLDAGAITAFAGQADALAKALCNRSAPVVLTPHAGEFQRLVDGSPDFASKLALNGVGDRLAAARALAAHLGAVLVLKGPDTVVAAPDGRASIAENAPPSLALTALATAGSGDVLAGLLAGLLARGMPGFEAASAAVWLHGDAARRCGRQSLTVEDLVGFVAD